MIIKKRSYLAVFQLHRQSMREIFNNLAFTDLGSPNN